MQYCKNIHLTANRYERVLSTFKMIFFYSSWIPENVITLHYRHYQFKFLCTIYDESWAIIIYPLKIYKKKLSKIIIWQHLRPTPTYKNNTTTCNTN